MQRNKLLTAFVAFSSYSRPGEKKTRKGACVTYEQLLEIAKERHLTQQQVVRMLRDLIIHNETHLISRISVGDHSGFDDVLLQVQPALALAVSLLEEHNIENEGL